MFSLARNLDILKLFQSIRRASNYVSEIKSDIESTVLEDKKEIEDLLNALKLTQKTWKANEHLYSIIKYDKLGMTYDMYKTIGIFRSVVMDDNGYVVAFAPPKSLYPNDEIVGNINKNYVGLVDSTDEWHAEEFIEGTMINLFYQPKDRKDINGEGIWEMATKSTVGARVSFFANFNKGKQEDVPIRTQDMFRFMFLDACNQIGFDFEKLPKNYSYSFVLQHSRNRIVCPIKKSSIYIVGVYKFNQDLLEVTDCTYSNEIDWNSMNIKKPMQYIYAPSTKEEGEMNVINYFKSKYATMNTSYDIVGVMFKNHVTGERVKFRNPSYEMVRSLRGNQPKLQYQYLALRQEGKVGEYLKYYPEHKKDFQIYRDQLHAYTSQLHQNYVSCYVKKEKPLNEFPKHFRTHMFALHQYYLAELRDKKEPVTKQRVIEYINKEHPAKQMYTLNFTMRKQMIEEERVILDEKMHEEVHGFEGESVKTE
jgi:hypothetical protein